MAVNGVNETETDAEETVLFTLEGDESNQVARRIWVPSGRDAKHGFPFAFRKSMIPQNYRLPGKVFN